MSDRCTVYLTISNADYPKVDELDCGRPELGWGPTDHPFAVEGEFPDEDDGGSDITAALKKAEIPYVLKHTGGDGYPSERYAYDGTHEERITTADGFIVCPCSEDSGDPVPHGVDHAKDYVTCQNCAYEAMKRRNEAKTD